MDWAQLYQQLSEKIMVQGKLTGLEKFFYDFCTYAVSWR